MVRRTARRGANAGSEFWGCSEFPRCRGIVQHQPPTVAPTDEGAAAPTQRVQDNAEEASAPDVTPISDKPRGFLNRVAQTIDKGHRWYLERDEPDATGRWGDDHRRRMLRYVYERDGGRCGLCAGETKIRGAQIEHVVPKVFVLFDVGKNGKAEPGTQYKSRLHKIDNPPGRPHLLQQAQGQRRRGRQVAPPRHAAAHRRGHRRRKSPRAAPEAEGSISALTPVKRQHHQHSQSVGRCVAMERESDKGETSAVSRDSDGSGHGQQARSGRWCRRRDSTATTPTRVE